MDFPQTGVWKAEVYHNEKPGEADVSGITLHGNKGKKIHCCLKYQHTHTKKVLNIIIAK